MSNQVVNNERELENALKRPFKFEEIEWRIGSSYDRNGEVKALALPYVTSRAIMDRLDEVFGFTGWSDEYKPWGNNAQLCGITVRLGDRTITKWDGAESTDIESVKGGLSNSLKRAAVKFGIGRYLYSFDPIWVRCEVKGKSKFIAKDEFETTLATFYKRQLAKIYGVDLANQYSATSVGNTPVRENRANYNSSNNNSNNGYSSNQAKFNNSQPSSTNREAFESSPKTSNSNGSNVKKVNNNIFSNNTDSFKAKEPKVPGAFLNFIKTTISSKGTNIKSILEFYSVSSLEDLTMEQANDLVAKLG